MIQIRQPNKCQVSQMSMTKLFVQKLIIFYLLFSRRTTRQSTRVLFRVKVRLAFQKATLQDDYKYHKTTKRILRSARYTRASNSNKAINLCFTGN